LLLAVASLAVVALASCAAGGDAALTEVKVKAALLEKLGTDALGIKVAVVGDKVTLTGAVSKRSTEELAEEVARSVEGVRKVDNRLEVVEGAPSSGNVEAEANDSLLESKVKMALAREIGRTPVEGRGRGDRRCGQPAWHPARQGAPRDRGQDRERHQGRPQGRRPAQDRD